jgi:hypothetical protein
MDRERPDPRCRWEPPTDRAGAPPPQGNISLSEP